MRFEENANRDSLDRKSRQTEIVEGFKLWSKTFSDDMKSQDPDDEAWERLFAELTGGTDEVLFE